ncbi:MAG: 2-amino-4-hydroxy-6-hydroxymethyldihydropteridine diphosphokinase [Armatimonadota bacterium]|nr:2-amino-4-hydroxy-6-hydroxymethyldihydropteridine diphosphokinase [Armatimonadota bacterium]
MGSNIGDRIENLRKAISFLDAEGVEIVKVSGLYETEPVETDEPQPPYLNAVAEIITNLPLTNLLDLLEEIERKLGRRSKGDKKPRTVDLDILWAEGEQLESERLKVPHPRLWERAFVLVPLSEIVDELDGKSVSKAAQNLANRKQIRKVAESQWFGEKKETKVI